MRNGNEEIRNGNEEMRLSMGKFVHVSQKLAHIIVSISFRGKSWQNWYIVNLTVRTDSEPYDRFETEVD